MGTVPFGYVSLDSDVLALCVLLSLVITRAQRFSDLKFDFRDSGPTMNCIVSSQICSLFWFSEIQSTVMSFGGEELNKTGCGSSINSLTSSSTLPVLSQLAEWACDHFRFSDGIPLCIVDSSSSELCRSKSRLCRS